MNYDPSEAKLILEQNEHLASDYELSEECVSSNGVFSEAGRSELLDAFTKVQQSGASGDLYLQPLRLLGGAT